MIYYKGKYIYIYKSNDEYYFCQIYDNDNMTNEIGNFVIPNSYIKKSKDNYAGIVNFVYNYIDKLSMVKLKEDAENLVIETEYQLRNILKNAIKLIGTKNSNNEYSIKCDIVLDSNELCPTYLEITQLWLPIDEDTVYFYNNRIPNDKWDIRSLSVNELYAIIKQLVIVIKK